MGTAIARRALMLVVSRIGRGQVPPWRGACWRATLSSRCRSPWTTRSKRPNEVEGKIIFRQRNVSRKWCAKAPFSNMPRCSQSLCTPAAAVEKVLATGRDGSSISTGKALNSWRKRPG